MQIAYHLAQPHRRQRRARRGRRGRRRRCRAPRRGGGCDARGDRGGGGLSDPCLGRIEGRPYATIICAGSDGENAQRQLDRIATGWRLRRVADPVIVNTDAQTPEAILAPKTIAADRLAEARDLGAALAEGLTAGIF